MQPMRWTKPEYEEKNRSVDWFWGLGLIAIIIAGGSIYFSNFLFAVFIIIAALSLGMFALRKPKDISYELSEKGLRIDETLYPFSGLSSFWVEKVHETPKIILASKKFFVPFIIVPIVDHDENMIRDFLDDRLPEVEHHEPPLHMILERFGL